MLSTDNSNGKATQKNPWRLVGLLIILVGLGSFSLWIYHSKRAEEQKDEIEILVRQSLFQKCATDKDFAGLEIAGIRLTKENSKKFTGYVVFRSDGETECTELSVTLDGDMRYYECSRPGNLIGKRARKRFDPRNPKTREESTSPLKMDTCLKVKGLYLGMDFKEASVTLKKILEGTKWKTYEQAMLRPELKKQRVSESDDNLIVTAYSEQRRILIKVTDDDIVKGLSQLVIDDEATRGRLWRYEESAGAIIGVDGKLVFVALQPRLINDLFNAQDMTNDEFIDMFKKSYHLPDDYQRLDGVKLRLSEKSLLMEKVPTAAENATEEAKIAAEREKSFN